MNLSNTGLEMDSKSLMRVHSLPDDEAAYYLNRCMVAMEGIWKRSFVSRGLILLEMEERELWRKLKDPRTGEPYASLGSWVVNCAPYSRSDCYAALKAVKELCDVPTDQLLNVERKNIGILQSLSTSVRRLPEVVKAAQTMSAKDFVKQVKADWPDQHLEDRNPIHLNPVDSAKTVIDEAIEMAFILEDLTTKESVIECWAVSYMEENRERYEQLRGQR